ncbi:MAG: MoxR family ATPase, partial [Lachnospiraceae bacterium]|nr:MoxR family ATPase [Lachnospiraceae bacterium]
WGGKNKPLQSQGTCPRPPGQPDRFFMKLSLGYMKRDEELAVMARPDTAGLLGGLECMVTPEEIAQLKAAYREVKVGSAAAGYLMDIVERTRNHADISVGASTRGAMALYGASQAAAAFAGRDYVLPEDVKALAPCILAHRLEYRGILRQSEGTAVFRELLDEIPVPTEEL